MKKYDWKNAKTENLWSVLSEKSGVQVKSMMDGWTKQSGHPVISVKSEDHFLEFAQVDFWLISEHASIAGFFFFFLSLFVDY